MIKLAVYIPSKNGVYTIVKVCKVILRMATLYSQLWPQFLSAEDKTALNDLVTCANAVINQLERSEYRP